MTFTFTINFINITEHSLQIRQVRQLVSQCILLQSIKYMQPIIDHIKIWADNKPTVTELNEVTRGS